MNRKIYCPCDSDFSQHYRSQAGNGFSDITLYRGQPYQRGYGFGSVFRRFGVPILQFLGKQFVKTGIDVGNDYLSGANLRSSFKARGRQGLKNAAKEGLSKLDSLVDQVGTGIRKRKRRKCISKKKDIFS